MTTCFTFYCFTDLSQAFSNSPVFFSNRTFLSAYALGGGRLRPQPPASWSFHPCQLLVWAGSILEAQVLAPETEVGQCLEEGFLSWGKRVYGSAASCGWSAEKLVQAPVATQRMVEEKKNFVGLVPGYEDWGRRILGISSVRIMKLGCLGISLAQTG